MVAQHGDDIPALVIGMGITALGAVRALSRAGIPTYAVCPPGDLVRRSRYYRGVTLAPWDGRRETPCDLDALSFPRAVLVPCSDEAAMWVAAHHAARAHRFPDSSPSTAVLEQVVDKARFAELLTELDVPHPFTRRLTCADQLAPSALPRGADPFVKPACSHAFFARYGVKGWRVQEGASTARQVAQALDDGLELMVQDYVPGPPTAHVFLDGFRDRTGVVRAWFARRRLRMYPVDFGNSTAMESIPLDDVRPAAEALERLLAHLRYRGVFSAEFKWDSRDGTFKLLEVNPRAWWYVEFAAWCGVNVVEMAWLDAQDRPVPSVTSYKVGRRCVYPYHDMPAWRAMPSEERPSRLAFYRSWLGARQPVQQLADPLPGVRDFLTKTTQAVLRRAHL